MARKHRQNAIQCLNKGHLNNRAFNKVRLAESIEHWTTDRKAVGSNALWTRIFRFVFCRFRRAPGRSHSNEIKHDFHPRYIQ